MPTLTGGFSVATGSSTPALYPVGSTANTMQSSGFIPEIWSGKLVEKFYASTVLAAISNTDYEGEIKDKGDRVLIRTKPTISIHDYLADGLLALDRPAGSNVELFIDQGKYFSLILDDVMEIQSDLNVLSMWSDDAAQQMKITVDTAVLKGIFAQAAAANRGATAGVITANLNLGTDGSPLSVVGRDPDTSEVEIVDVLLRLGQALDEQNIPEVGRWVVLPAWAGRMIKQSELRQAYLSGDSVTMLRNGRLGMIDRFTVYISNLLPNGNSTAPGYDVADLSSGNWAVYAGHAHALTFATQISKVETLRSELTFGQILRGLQVYGYKVIDGRALTQAVITQGS
jgi:hypothetical protein